MGRDRDTNQPVTAPTLRISMAASEQTRAWSATDDSYMLRHIEQNHSIEEIAQFLNRRPEDIRSRLELLADEAKAPFLKDIAAS